MTFSNIQNCLTFTVVDKGLLLITVLIHPTIQALARHTYVQTLRKTLSQNFQIIFFSMIILHSQIYYTYAKVKYFNYIKCSVIGSES
jgi:hypothetical protein